MPFWELLQRTCKRWLGMQPARRAEPVTRDRSAAPPLRVESLENRKLLSAGTGLTAQYYGDMTLSHLLMMRTDPTVDFDLAPGHAPAAGLSSTQYSVRWTGQVLAPNSGTYTFSTVSDDGIRLMVDGKTLINDWSDHSARTDNGTITLTGGQKYSIEVDYYQDGGSAVAELMWSGPKTAKEIIPTADLYPATPAGAGTGLIAQYYKNTNLSGTPAVTQIAPQINFSSPTGQAPVSGLPHTDWSARWTGTVQPTYTGTYTFYTTSDDGIRVFVNGKEIIDNWAVHAPTPNSGSITLTAGQQYAIEVDYFQAAGGATAELSWSGPSTPKQIIPKSALYPTPISGDSPPPSNPSPSNWFSQNLRDPALASLASSLYNSSGRQLTYDDMMTIFGTVEKAGSVTSTELADLRTLVANGAALGMPAAVQDLASKVLNSNPANATYQGQSLGNLAVGSTATHLEELVDKWFLGLDTPAVASGVTYAYASGSLFGSGGPSYTDVVQGDVGDCYFLAALAEEAIHSPGTIESMFTNNGNGTYTVRFYDNGVADYVTVDSDLPSSGGDFFYANAGAALNSSSNVLWVALAEKAYAQVAQEGWSRPTAANTYSAIDLGWEGNAINQLTGRSETSQLLTNDVATLGAIVSDFNAGGWVALDSNSSTATGIVANHVYVMLGYNSATHVFNLYNPWGYVQQLTWSQVAANFSYFSRNMT